MMVNDALYQILTSLDLKQVHISKLILNLFA